MRRARTCADGVVTHLMTGHPGFAKVTGSVLENPEYQVQFTVCNEPVFRFALPASVNTLVAVSGRRDLVLPVSLMP